jgi:hypothetical protein
MNRLPMRRFKQSFFAVTQEAWLIFEYFRILKLYKSKFKINDVINVSN